MRLRTASSLRKEIEAESDRRTTARLNAFNGSSALSASVNHTTHRKDAIATAAYGRQRTLPYRPSTVPNIPFGMKIMNSINSAP